MYSSKYLIYALVLCNIAAVLLLTTTGSNRVEVLESWTQLDNELLSFIQDFGHPPERVRIRTIEATPVLTRKTITIDINQGYPQTEFHRQLNRTLQRYGATTYANVSFPDRLSTIHILFDDTVVRTIRFQRSSPSN
ncbi:MAG: hypothetical protein JJU41_01135 [Bacteroidetes bacterium]|nr:hypothetical protein [Bacteroidota bacterium]MCH8522979.1 hypothetical protein [Balneolales bacterium]